MAENERYLLIFDKEFVQISIELEWKRSGRKVSPIGPGASVIVNHEFDCIRIEEDNMMAMYSSSGLSDPYYPVINMDTRQIVGIYFPEEQFWRLYPGQKVLKGARVEFGRYLAFVSNWRVVHKAMIVNCEGKPGSALLMLN